MSQDPEIRGELEKEATQVDDALKTTDLEDKTRRVARASTTSRKRGEESKERRIARLAEHKARDILSFLHNTDFYAYLFARKREEAK